MFTKALTYYKIPAKGQILYIFISLLGGPLAAQWQQSGSNMYLPAGNVGIGTATPKAKLDIKGNILFSEPIEGYEFYNITVEKSSYNVGEYNPNSSRIGGTLAIKAGDCGYTTFQDDFVEAGDLFLSAGSIPNEVGAVGQGGSVYISAGKGHNNGYTGNVFIAPNFGNVLIGGGSYLYPQEKLDVRGNTKTTGFIMPTGAVNGHVLTTDANGVATWKPGSAAGWNSSVATEVSSDRDVRVGAGKRLMFGVPGTGEYIHSNRTGTSDINDIRFSTGFADKMILKNSGELYLLDNKAAGERMLSVGDDSYFSDVDNADVVGIIGAYSAAQYGGNSTNTAGGFMLGGAQGGLIFGRNGNVAIGTKSVQNDYKLTVAGNIRARRMRVDADAWPDYVFEENYSLTSLQETENFIQQHGHLPGVPSAKEVKEKGIDLSEMNVILLQKIEEMTLHILDLEKRVKAIE